jgi:hypothetical protein
VFAAVVFVLGIMPPHTPGHVTIRLKSDGEYAAMTGERNRLKRGSPCSNRPARVETARAFHDAARGLCR